MDYTEAELEARIFPSVDIDPKDWEEGCEEDWEEQEFDEVYDDIEDAPVEQVGIEAYAHQMSVHFKCGGWKKVGLDKTHYHIP